jgi:hypothetical protein
MVHPIFLYFANDLLQIFMSKLVNVRNIIPFIAMETAQPASRSNGKDDGGERSPFVQI